MPLQTLYWLHNTGEIIAEVKIHGHFSGLGYDIVPSCDWSSTVCSDVGAVRLCEAYYPAATKCNYRLVSTPALYWVVLMFQCHQNYLPFGILSEIFSQSSQANTVISAHIRLGQVRLRIFFDPLYIKHTTTWLYTTCTTDKSSYEILNKYVKKIKILNEVFWIVTFRRN
jgi:hypothetical protein